MEKGFSKYMLYAIGEMILVIIGILIAFQINNWNEGRKAKALSNEMLIGIKSGLESDIKELNKFISNQQIVMNSQGVVSDWLKDKGSFQDSLSQHFALVYVSTDFTINYAGYETLKQFGLRRIDNDSLRNSVANLYEVKYPTFIKYIDVYQLFLEELLANNSKHFTELNYMGSTMKPLNELKLKADNDYIYNLNTLKNFNQLLIYSAYNLNQEMKMTYSKF